MFDFSSRYFDIETGSYTASDGRHISYKRRRFLPQGKTLTVLKEVTVVGGDRLDRIANDGLGDPEQFWQICDANDALNPAELTGEIGKILKIPLPQI